VKKNEIPILAQLADIILSGVGSATGGRLRIVLNGVAAINPDTQKFLVPE
jgi:long-subunit acyl-CoA synthetase (AMP-forming)